MSTSFFAPEAAVATRHLTFNLSATNAGNMLVLAGLDTFDAMDDRGMVAGELPAAQVAQAAATALAEATDPYMTMRLRELRDLAEAAVLHGSTVAWA
jgi:hypothetical protein